MVDSGELHPRPQLQERVGELLEDAFLLENEVHESPLFLHLESVRLLQPSFPDMEGWQFKKPILEEQYPIRDTVVSKLISKLIDLIPEEPSNDPSVSFSPTFITRHRNIRGGPDDRDPWALVEVSETSYEGTIVVDGQTFEFAADQPLIEARSSRLDSGTIQVASSVYFAYVPHRDFIATNFSRETAHSFPCIDTEATPHENISSIVEAALQIER